jgi:hypothetical protein
MLSVTSSCHVIYKLKLLLWSYFTDLRWHVLFNTLNVNIQTYIV